MKRVITSHIEVFILVAIVLLAILLRLLWLDRFPVSITGDELFYVLSAKALFLTGQGITGMWSPFSALLFQYQPGSAPQAELSYFLLLPFVGTFPFSLFLVRLPFALLSVGIVYVLYLFTTEISTKKVGLLVAFLAAVNPWLVVMGRTAYEVTPAMFFYFLGGYALLKLRGWKILYTLPIFLLAFYSYIGTKIILFPLLLVLCSYKYFSLKETKDKTPYVVLFGGVFLFLLFYFLSITHTPGSSRLGEILLPTNSSLATRVDELRKSTINTPLLSLFINKYSLYVSTVSQNFGNIFSFSYLFLHGDSFFGLWQQGLFYLIDSVGIGIGIVALWMKKRREGILLSLLVLISCIPQMIYRSSENFTPHITMLIPFLLVICAFGIEEVSNFHKKFGKLLFWGIGVLYVFSVLSFLSVYFLQYPIQGKTDFAVRELANYITVANDSNKNIVVHSTHSEDLFYKYLFYSNNYSKETIATVQKRLKQKTYQIENVTFTDCIKSIDITKTKDIHIVDAICGGTLTATSQLKIVLLTDSGEAFIIYNDTFCSEKGLQPFVSKLTISDFAIEKLSPDVFCKTFIVY